MNSLLDFFMNFSGPTPYLLVMGVLMLCGLGLPLPEDVVLFAAGMMAYYDVAKIEVMIAVCFIGVLIGDGFVFTLGSLFGKTLRRHWFVKKLLPLHRQRLVRRKLHEQGNRVIFLARFMPGLRTPIFFTSGMMHLPPRLFILFDGLAALISVPAIVYVVYRFGYAVDQVIHVIKKIQFGIAATVVVFFLLFTLKIYWSLKKEKELEKS